MTNISSVKGILVSLIESIDMYNFLLRDHHRRTAVIAYQLGNHYGLDPVALSNLVLAASIHDIGALYVTQREQLLYVDAVDTQGHEELGAEMLSEFKPFSNIAAILRHHHIKYRDAALGSISPDEVPQECYFLHLADRIDVLLTTSEGAHNPRQVVIDEITKRFGTVFLPKLSSTFFQLAATDEFWENIQSSSFHDLLFMSVESDACTLTEDDMDGLAAVFARIVDFKSQWTVHHSSSVSVLAENIGRMCGLSAKKCHELKIAGYLHDIGKIAIPSEVLDKPGALDMEEYKVMKSHAMYSSLILSKVPFLGDAAKWAGSHHEKRDHSGYPLQMGESQFSMEIDILAYSDIFASLAESRPYRAPLSKNKINEILRTFSNGKLSQEVFEVIDANMDTLYTLNLDAMSPRISA